MAYATGTSVQPRDFYQGANGRYYPRVTAILSVIGKPALLNWMAKTEREATIAAAGDIWEQLASLEASVEPRISRAAFEMRLDKQVGEVKAGRRISEKAAAIGNEAHEYCEWVLLKMMGKTDEQEPQISREARFAAASAEAWIRDSGFQPTFVEQRVFSDQWNYAGTLDFMGLIGDKLIIGDWKTGKALYPEAKLQAAAYAAAIEEMGHGRVVGAAICRLPKTASDPPFEVLKIGREKLDEYFDVFKHAIGLWSGMKSMEGER